MTYSKWSLTSFMPSPVLADAKRILTSLNSNFDSNSVILVVKSDLSRTTKSIFETTMETAV